MINRKILILLFLIFFYVNILFPVIAQMDTSETYLFSVHMIAPTSNPVRMQVAQLVESELPKIGIDTELDLISWAAMFSHTDRDVGMYSEGGYDITLFGMSISNSWLDIYGATIKSVFTSEGIPPGGGNYMYWSNETGKNYNNYRAQESENLIAKVIKNFNRTEIRSDKIAWQKLWYDVMPNIVIYNQLSVQPISSYLFGFDSLGISSNPLDSVGNLWFDNDESVLRFATSGSPKTFNSMLSTDVYSLYSASPPMEGLVGFSPSSSIVLPSNYNKTQWMIDNFGTAKHNELYPRLADSIGFYSSDHLQYNISVRDNVFWHDGTRFDAWDVAFSFQAHISPNIGSRRYSNLLVPFGLDNKANQHGNYSFIVEDKDGNDFFESISFQFNTGCPYFESDFLGTDLFPEHILGDPANHGFEVNGDFNDGLWLIPPNEWKDHSTTTGRTTDPGGYTGPIGVGPVIFKEYSSSTGDITLEKFQNIAWDGSEWVENTNVSYYNLDSINKMPDTINIQVSDERNALDSLITGEVHILDTHFYLNDFIKEIRNEDSIRPIYIPHLGWQGLFMNPQFNQDGVYHFQKKGVRHAISHMIPRSDIVEYLLDGLAQPAHTPISLSSRSVIPEQELIQYKKSLLALDGSFPEAGTITAYDDYNIDLAIEWMRTEGYEINPPFTATPIFNPIPGITIFITILTLLSLSIYLSKIKKR